MKLDSWVLDVVLCVFFLLMLREGRLVLGKERTSIFLWGSILWTAIIENVMVILGGYDYFAYAGYYTFGGRTIDGYGGWFSWALYVPLAICLGWFLLSLPVLLMSIRIFGDRRSIWVKAAFAGLMLVSFDMLLDPISVVNEWWRWTSPGFYLRGVTLGNYIGWFFLLFFFGAIFERTVLQKGGFAWPTSCSFSLPYTSWRLTLHFRSWTTRPSHRTWYTASSWPHRFTPSISSSSSLRAGTWPPSRRKSPSGKEQQTSQMGCRELFTALTASLQNTE
jgi:hypothetical protein